QQGVGPAEHRAQGLVVHRLVGQPGAVVTTPECPPQRGLRVQRRALALVEPQPDERLRAGGKPLLSLGALAFDAYQLVTPVDIDTADPEELGGPGSVADAEREDRPVPV